MKIEKFLVQPDPPMDDCDVINYLFMYSCLDEFSAKLIGWY